MARVRCIMMQRDEHLLLDAWVRHYAYLFGFENLLIFDNGSTDPAVLDTLTQYETAGVSVLREHNRIEDFHGKNDHFRNVISNWDARGDYDFVLPLDCDEFLGVCTKTGASFSRSAIHAHFNALLGERRALKISPCLFNIPDIPAGFRACHFTKTFVAARTLQTLDHGFHAATSHAETGWRETDFVYIHMHNKPFALLCEHARRKLAYYVDVTDHKALSTYRGPGHHLAPYLLTDEQTWQEKLRKEHLFGIPSFITHMQALGIRSAYFGCDKPASHSGDTVHLLDIGSNGYIHEEIFDPQKWRQNHPDSPDTFKACLKFRSCRQGFSSLFSKPLWKHQKNGLLGT